MAKPVKLWIDTNLAEELAEKITQIYPPFNAKDFIEAISTKVDALEFKDRNRVFAKALRDYLPSSYPEAVEILIQIMGPENPNETGMFSEFYWLVPVYTFFEEYALEDYDASLKATYEVTKRSTGEYCIRPLILAQPEKTMQHLETWSTDPSFHIRRLASEGCRPRLPWSARMEGFVKDPSPIKPILSNLKNDPTVYVQKSVANNIGDILKDNPEIGYAWIQEWLDDKPTKITQLIIKHSIRTPLKKEHPEAFQILKQLKLS